MAYLGLCSNTITNLGKLRQWNYLQVTIILLKIGRQNVCYWFPKLCMSNIIFFYFIPLINIPELNKRPSFSHGVNISYSGPFVICCVLDSRIYIKCVILLIIVYDYTILL